MSSNISIVFTKEGETADNYIERTVDAIGRKFDVVVVTSDSLEQQVTFQRVQRECLLLNFIMKFSLLKK